MITNLLFFLMLSSGNIQYFFLFHFIWSTKTVNTCSQHSNIMWGLQHLWSLFLEIYLVISQNVDPVFPNKAKARKSLIFQLSYSQSISTKLKFHQSDANSWESKSEVSKMGWGWGGGGKGSCPQKNHLMNVVLAHLGSLWVMMTELWILKSVVLQGKSGGRNYFWLCRVLSVMSEEPVDCRILYNKSCFCLNWQEWIL